MRTMCGYYQSGKCLYYAHQRRVSCGGNVDRCLTTGGPPAHICGCKPGRDRCPEAKRLFRRAVDEFEALRDNLFHNDWSKYNKALREYNRHYPRGDE